jgi:hypothetical protein
MSGACPFARLSSGDKAERPIGHPLTNGDKEINS